MVFARIKTADGVIEDNLYMNMKHLGHELLTNKETMLDVLRLEVCGKTYAERKEYLRTVAIFFQVKDDGEADILLSMGERAAIEDWFYMNAKRYGLTEEFSLNGII